MSVSHVDFLETASGLLAPELNCESSWRSSISRAYYGFYHASLAYADEVSVPPVSAQSGGSHAKLSDFYIRGGSALDAELRNKYRQIGYTLRALHELRCKSDYRLNEDVARIDAESTYKRCVEKIALVEGLRSSKAA